MQISYHVAFEKLTQKTDMFASLKHKLFISPQKQTICLAQF